MKALSYRIEEPSGLADYVLRFALSTLGLSHRPTDADKTDIHYGNDADAGAAIRIPVNEEDVLWRDLLDGDVAISNIGDVLPFDLVSGITAFLTDRVNQNARPEDYDEHERLTYDGSFQAKSGYGDVAIVNRYVSFLGELIESRLPVRTQPLWPEGKKCAIALSHDVDAPMKHGASGGPLVAPHASLKRNIQTNLYRIKWHVERLFGSTGLEHWHFPFIMDAESFSGFKSSFMFAVTRRFDHEGHPDYDVSYDAGAPRFLQLYQDLTTRDFEICLHAGYLSYRNPARFEEERTKLEELAQTPVRGVRHHAWHTGPDVEASLEAHEYAGFEFDSSLAFNLRDALRRSVALPFRPWSERLGRAIDVIQIPVALMDGHIFYHRVREAEAIRQVRQSIDRIREIGGVGAIDWHVRTSSPQSKQFAVWGRTYRALLDHLAGQEDVWVTNLGEICDWVRAREKRLESVDN